VKSRSVDVAVLAVIAVLTAPAAGQIAKAPATATVPKDMSADFVLPGPAEPLPAPLRAAIDGMRAEAPGAHVDHLGRATAWLIADR
jgi:hypothetical protein